MIDIIQSISLATHWQRCVGPTGKAGKQSIPLDYKVLLWLEFSQFENPQKSDHFVFKQDIKNAGQGKEIYSWLHSSLVLPDIKSSRHILTCKKVFKTHGVNRTQTRKHIYKVKVHYSHRLIGSEKTSKIMESSH